MPRRYYRLVFICFVLILSSSGLTRGSNIDRLDSRLRGNDIELQKEKHGLSLLFKTYQISPIERISLYGAKHRYFFKPNWYFGEIGYGAISGKRSGYLEGGFIAGYTKSLNQKWLLDTQLSVGAGGGGSAPQGGGLQITPSLGIGYQFSSAVSLTGELGYIHFLNGDISSLTMGVALTMMMWRVI